MAADDLILALIILCSMMLGFGIMYFLGCRLGNRCLRRCLNQNDTYRGTVGIINPLVLRQHSHQFVVQISPANHTIQMIPETAAVAVAVAVERPGVVATGATTTATETSNKPPYHRVKRHSSNERKFVRKGRNSSKDEKSQTDLTTQETGLSHISKVDQNESKEQNK